MAGEKSYLSVPPDSTGKKVRMTPTVRVFYSGKNRLPETTAYVWSIGEEYPITGFGDVHVHEAVYLGDTGYIDIHITDPALLAAGDLPQAGDLIQSDDATFQSTYGQVATVTAAEYHYYNVNQIVGTDNPSYGWEIDKFGSGNVRFSEGNAEVAASGGLRTVQQTLLSQYDFSLSALASEFTNTLQNGGTATYDGGAGEVLVKVTSDTGSTATNTSNVYHPYVPGANQLLYIAARLSSADTLGVVRRWGIFDSQNGFFFQKYGTELAVVHRRTFNGVTTPANETDYANGVIRQTMWNKDKLDGTGPSGMVIDLEKANLFWIDFQQLGGSRIRWGVYYNGERITCHDMDMGNGGPLGGWIHNAVRNANLPICWAARTLDGSTWAGEERTLYALGAGVWAEGIGNTKIIEEGPVRQYDESFSIQIDTNEIDVPYGGTGSSLRQPWSQGAYYIFTLKPLETVPDGAGGTIPNRTLYFPKTLEAQAFTNDSAVGLNGEIRVFAQCILKQENYTPISYTTVSRDEQAWHVGHGPEILRVPIKQGFGEFNFGEAFTDIQNGTLKNNSESGGNRTQSIAQVSNSYDNEGTGITGKVGIRVGYNPIYGTQQIHLFNDRTPITVSGLTQNGPNSLNGNTYYLSIDDGSRAALYTSEDLIDSDRAMRTIQATGLTTPSAAADFPIASTLFVSGAGSARIFDFDSTGVGTANIKVDGRNNAALNVGLTSGILSVGDSAGAAPNLGNVASVTKNYAFPYDLRTIVNAVDGSAWVTGSEGTGSAASPTAGSITGSPPVAPPWTFMWRPLGGDAFTHPNGETIQISLTWKERNQ